MGILCVKSPECSTSLRCEFFTLSYSHVVEIYGSEKSFKEDIFVFPHNNLLTI